MICPLMSKPIATIEPGDNPRIEVEWVNCEKEKCAWWVGLYVREGQNLISCEYGCAINRLALKQPEGTIQA